MLVSISPAWSPDGKQLASAGNDRSLDAPDPVGSVVAPAVADAALAVGSVTKQDQTSVFSPRGPRPGDYAVKPDIAAPGTDIVSARAAGTPAGDADPVSRGPYADRWRSALQRAESVVVSTLFPNEATGCPVSAFNA